VSAGALRRLLHEPLVHFLVLGAGLFALFALVGRPAGERRERIVVTPGQIESLAGTFARTWQRPPTPLELDALIEDHVRDQVYAREAAALGLDRDDVVVRRRLRQKMEFLTEEAADAAPPTDEQLAAFLAAHPDAYRVEPRLAFRQVYLSHDRRGDAVDADARAALAKLDAQGPDADISRLGDPLILPQDVALSPRSEIARLFGEPFADRLLEAEPGRWVGPIESGYGSHVVYVQRRETGRTPRLAEVHDAVARDWELARRKETLEAAYRKLRERYDVQIPVGSAIR
jgi:hypothetical protein